MAGWDSDYRFEPTPLFEQTFRCLPYSEHSNPDLQIGDKIIMPASALNRIVDLGLRHPFLFKISGFNSDKISHCGVLQFDAEEGFVHVPDWMMRNLSLSQGAPLVLRDATLSRGVSMKLQPHAMAFVDLEDPRAALEQGLRGFTCLSRGDTFAIKHGGTDFKFDVLDVYPGDAINLIDTDCLLDLAPPLDYKEPPPPSPSTKQSIVDEGVGKEEVFRPFSGTARRLDGMPVVATGGASVVEEKKKDGGKGKEEGKELGFKPFTGRSRTLEWS